MSAIYGPLAMTILVRSLVLAFALVLSVPACNAWSSVESGPAAAPARKVKVDRASLPVLELTDAELSRFKQGDALFEAVVRESDGLGPLYVRDACSACHVDDGRGPGLVTKMAPRQGVQVELEKLLPFGTTERPYAAAGAKTPLLAPQDSRLVVTHRLPPAVFGRGYLEAIADQDIERLAERAAARSGSARGRLSRLKDGTIGRFGVKARISTLESFVVDALSSDMGLSSPAQPEEPPGPEGLRDDHKLGVDFSAEQVALLRDYLQGLAIPQREPSTGLGPALFAEVGCADCHEPELRTRADYPVRALAGVSAVVYTDLLLHDMGEALSDGQHEEGAKPREFRTAPLMGLRFLPSLLHDGSAKTVHEAILAHGAADSEGRDAARAFLALSSARQAELVSFVETL
ncbi:MAG: putative thiol oxidoreductase [Polyangiaceae bacterium]|jgi:CxxC motif-containing protein (DUF1111 family)|nr:putative thiol oxidoreductase [Polyangiaceae bacterium]